MKKKIKKYIQFLIDSLLEVLYPRVCQACGIHLFKNEEIICLFCEARLPKTNFHYFEENPVEQLFWGRCQINAATALYVYQPGGKVQHLIHQFKYKGKKEIGVYLGENYGRDLMKSERFNSVEVLIPIPLHINKIKKRGFNQSELIVDGLAKSMNAIKETQNLIRTVATESQTRKNRWERYKNTKEIFAILEPNKLKNKHILIVDDVITTGSTIEACVNVLKEIEGIKISIAALASAAH